ncbi:Rid family hydrolase [Halosolutus halophilus]|uniref:Rid family hydrolase n=1 Tax=Halosolutus halophilus TaxID=1552990 RepID=UPI0022352092|nr:Rid family hydrolase [Halosolutus halophilus]
MLDEIDKDYTDIPKVMAYVVKPHDRLEDVISVWDEFFDSPYPCHTLIGVDQLALEGLLIEIDVEVPLEE